MCSFILLLSIHFFFEKIKPYAVHFFMLYNVAFLANRMMVMVQERGKAEIAPMETLLRMLRTVKL